MRQTQKQLNLARKYRPKSLADLQGQASVVQILSEALKSDKIAPAYLLSGPRGVGKTSTARILAKAACCLSENFAERPCNQCASCKAIEQNGSMDILEIDGASHTGVDDVRSIIEAVAYRPSVGKRNVYIVDEVHMLSNAAFNALLKTLEEPPAHALFIFATTEIEKLPSTVLSRVQRLELRRLKEKDIFENLKEISKREKIQISIPILEQISAAADGSLRDGQTLLEQIFLLSGSQEISQEVVDAFLGTIGTAQEIELLELLAQKDALELVKRVHLFYEKGKDLVKLLSRLVQWIRVLVLCKATGNPELVQEEVSIDYVNRLLNSYANWSAGDIDRLFEVFWKAHERMKNSDFPKITLETTLLRAGQIPHTEDIGRLLKMIQSQPLQAKTKQAPPSIDLPKPKAPLRKAPAAAKPVSPAPQELKSISDLMTALKKERPHLWALMKCHEKAEWNSPKLRFIFPLQHFAYKQLSEKLMRDELTQVFSTLTGTNIQLSLEETAQKKKLESKRTDFIKEAREQILSDPLVQKATEILDGKVSSVTVEGIKT